MMTRAFLLALLPVIALAIYIDGQKYNPEVFEFTRASESSLVKVFPLVSKTLARDRQVRLYTKENLYEYVDGHAEFFITSGFKSLAVSGYQGNKEKTDDPPVVAEIYDMGSPEGALGVISKEAMGLNTFDGAWFIGYKSGNSVMFIKGPYYVKLNIFIKDGMKTLNALAKDISDNIGEIKTELPQFAKFPEAGGVKGSGGYVSGNYMGLDFMANVFTCKYKRDGKEFTAFLVAPENNKRFLSRMLSFYDETGVQVDSFLIDSAKVWEIQDKYEGVWSMARIGSEFIGVTGLEQNDDRLAFLKEIVAKGSEK
ncbi:hypothetical protein MNBD_NITROSPINAE04-1647 [hydrothermal vent metagenome]|uniref:Uncharacterized protein n=1 Tax=hydrothermal vent metagenome TaxID=652676 RepID=A0A3B1C6B4_9ZZZZ